MHPIERLRWIARAEGESAALLAAEAAWTLGELAATEPAAVLTAARRLLHRHPAVGPLWWVAAQLVASDVPEEAARRAAGELGSDPTGGRLAETLRAEFAGGDVVVVATPTDLAGEAFARTRPYLVRVVAEPRRLRSEIRNLASAVEDVTGWMPEEADEALQGASVVIVEVLAASAQVVSVAPAAAGLIEAAARSGVPAWAVVGVGRALPDRLAAASAERAAACGDAVALRPSDFVLAVGPSGRGEPAQVMGATTAVAGLELLHRIV
jgi:hypothetical protein